MLHSNANEKSIKELITELLSTYRLGGKLNETRLIGKWNDVVGKIIASHTRNLYISNKKLFVTIDSSVVRSELMYSKEKLINRLNRAVGSEVIVDIIFK